MFKIFKTFHLIVILVLFSAISTKSFAQKDSSMLNLPLGKITFEHAEKLDSLEKKMRGKNEMRGYRIQIFLGSYADAKNMRAKFLASGLKMQAYIVQNTPDYVVRVGDFRTSLEAQKHFIELKKMYPSALLVVDRIEPPRFYK
jgi:hypothetical protein